MPTAHSNSVRLGCDPCGQSLQQQVDPKQVRVILNAHLAIQELKLRYRDEVSTARARRIELHPRAGTLRSDSDVPGLDPHGVYILLK